MTNYEKSPYFEDDRSPLGVRLLGWLIVATALVAITVVLFRISENKKFADYICKTADNGEFEQLELVCGIATWFDPVFFQYNFLLFLFCISIIPIFTYFYTVRMKEEKVHRIRKQLPVSMWKEDGKEIIDRIGELMSFKNYLGCMTVLNVIVIFGVGLLLLMKPMQVGVDGAVGIDFEKGANFLMLGPFMSEYIGDKEVFMKWLTVSLTAFQFGFGGAYIYFLTHLVRSYFTLDLTPDLFVSSSVRMILGSVISIVFCFALIEIEVDSEPTLNFVLVNVGIGWLPAISFLIGYFPARSMLYLDKAVSSIAGWKSPTYKSIQLSELAGMSHAHEVRLHREGFDNVENLSTANRLDLLLRTGFSYAQLTNWIGEAKLRTHLREDYDKFCRLSGLRTLNEMFDFISGKDVSEISATWDQLLLSNSKDGAVLANKVKIISELLIKNGGAL